MWPGIALQYPHFMEGSCPWWDYLLEALSASRSEVDDPPKIGITDGGSIQSQGLIVMVSDYVNYSTSLVQ